MKSVVKVDIEEPREFGGYGNFILNQVTNNNKDVSLIGEAAGFQDALWGFGLRYAMYSGYLAAKSILTGGSYAQMCNEKILPMMETSLANRWLFAHLGNYGYDAVLNFLSGHKNIIGLLRRHHKPTRFKRLVFQLAKKWYHTRLVDKQCLHQNCDCIWCRHCKENFKSTEVLST